MEIRGWWEFSFSNLFVRISLILSLPWENIFKHSRKNCWNLHSRFRLEARDWRKEILVLVAKPEVEIKHKTKRTKVSLSSRMLKYVSRQTLMVTNQHLKESSNIHQKPPIEPDPRCRKSNIIWSDEMIVEVLVEILLVKTF